MDFKRLPSITQYIVSEFDKDTTPNTDSKISVDPLVADVASLYEKFRTAMDYREEDVILRATIERILKRRLLLGGSSQTIAEPLLRELVWARYFADRSVPESLIGKTKSIIDLYLNLQEKVNLKHKNNKGASNEWIIHLLSAEISQLLDPNKEKEILAGFMFKLYVEKVTLATGDEQTRDIQVFIAIRRTFARDDLPFLRFHLFKQIFGAVSEKNLDSIAQNFFKAKKEIESQLIYPQRDKIYTYIKNQSIPFFILEDVLQTHKGNNKALISKEGEFGLAILTSCQQKYKGIRAKVKRAIIRGFIFILITKALFALSIEGTFENLVYGQVAWLSISINTGIPPLLMVIAGLFIKTPGKENSIKILERIRQIVYLNEVNFVQPLNLKKSKKIDPVLNLMFILLWLLAFSLSLGAVIFVLTWFNFNIISQGIFIFFLAIVSFISYRISQTAHMYTLLEGRQSLWSLLFDFFFMPIIHLGRNLTENISKINLLLIIFDILIETPFKGIFAFFEQWFLFLRTQREKLG